MIEKILTRGVSAGALAALLSACGHLPIAEPAFEAMTAKRAGMPNDWTVAPMTGDPAAVISDYSVFQDAQLVSYVQEALENNRTLRAAVEAVRQSEASLQQTRSRLFPQVGASVGAGTRAFTDDLSNNQDNYSFALTAQYDADIMGDLNASIQASAAGLRSTEAVYEQTRRQIAAQVARSYFIVIEQEQQLDLDRKSLDRQRQTFRITQTRFDAGSIARDELVLGESRLAQAEDSILASEASLRAAVRALETGARPFPAEQAEPQGRPARAAGLAAAGPAGTDHPVASGCRLGRAQHDPDVRQHAHRRDGPVAAAGRQHRAGTGEHDDQHPRATCSALTGLPCRSAHRWRRRSLMAAQSTRA